MFVCCILCCVLVGCVTACDAYSPNADERAELPLLHDSEHVSMIVGSYSIYGWVCVLDSAAGEGV